MSAWVRKVCAACGLSAAQDDDDAAEAAAAAAAVADENDQGRDQSYDLDECTAIVQCYFLIELLNIAIASWLSNFCMKEEASPALGR